MKMGQLLGTLGAAFLLLPVSAFAAGGELGDYYFGPEAGFAILNAGAGAHPEFGFSLGGRLMPNLLLGAFYSYVPYGSVSSPDGTSASGSEKFYGGQLTWDFTPVIPGFMAGARAGFSNVSTQSFTVANGEYDDSNTGLAWGPLFSYEQPISSLFTFGGELVFMLPSESNAPNMFQLSATLKWWF